MYKSSFGQSTDINMTYLADKFSNAIPHNSINAIDDHGVHAASSSSSVNPFHHLARPGYLSTPSMKTSPARLESSDNSEGNNDTSVFNEYVDDGPILYRPNKRRKVGPSQYQDTAGTTLIDIDHDNDSNYSNQTPPAFGELFMQLQEQQPNALLEPREEEIPSMNSVDPEEKKGTRKILAKVQRLWLESIPCGRPRDIAGYVVDKHGNQMPYDRQFWSSAFKTKDGSFNGNHDEGIRNVLMKGVECLQRFVNQIETAGQILEIFLTNPKNTNRIPGDLTDDYLKQWLSGTNATLIRKLLNEHPEVQDVQLPTSLNYSNLQRALDYGGLLVKLPAHSQRAVRNNFNLCSAGRGDVRYSEIHAPDGQRRLDVKKSRTTLAIPQKFVASHIHLPKICVFQIDTKLELLLFYKGNSQKRPKRTSRSSSYENRGSSRQDNFTDDLTDLLISKPTAVTSSLFDRLDGPNVATIQRDPSLLTSNSSSSLTSSTSLSSLMNDPMLECQEITSPSRLSSAASIQSSSADLTFNAPKPVFLNVQPNASFTSNLSPPTAQPICLSYTSKQNNNAATPSPHHLTISQQFDLAHSFLQSTGDTHSFDRTSTLTVPRLTPNQHFTSLTEDTFIPNATKSSSPNDDRPNAFNATTSLPGNVDVNVTPGTRMCELKTVRLSNISREELRDRGASMFLTETPQGQLIVLTLKPIPETNGAAHIVTELLPARVSCTTEGNQCCNDGQNLNGQEKVDGDDKKGPRSCGRTVLNNKDGLESSYNPPINLTH